MDTQEIKMPRIVKDSEGNIFQVKEIDGLCDLVPYTPKSGDVIPNALTDLVVPYGKQVFIPAKFEGTTSSGERTFTVAGHHALIRTKADFSIVIRS